MFISAASLAGRTIPLHGFGFGTLWSSRYVCFESISAEKRFWRA